MDQIGDHFYCDEWKNETKIILFIMINDKNYNQKLHKICPCFCTDAKNYINKKFEKISGEIATYLTWMKFLLLLHKQKLF